MSIAVLFSVLSLAFGSSLFGDLSRLIGTSLRLFVSMMEGPMRFNSRRAMLNYNTCNSITCRLLATSI